MNPLGRANNLSIFKISINSSPHCHVIVMFDPLKSYKFALLNQISGGKIYNIFWNEQGYEQII